MALAPSPACSSVGRWPLARCRDFRLTEAREARQTRIGRSKRVLHFIAARSIAALPAQAMSGGHWLPDRRPQRRVRLPMPALNLKKKKGTGKQLTGSASYRLRGRLAVVPFVGLVLAPFRGPAVCPRLRCDYDCLPMCAPAAYVTFTVAPWIEFT